MVINTTAWSTTPHDDTRLNRMTNVSNTGAVLATLDKTKFGLFICTASGSGLILDHVYLCNAAGDALIDLTQMSQHTHESSSTGGDLSLIVGGNHRSIDLLLTKVTDLYEANWTTPVYWIKAVTSTGSVENNTSGTGERAIRLRPNATSGSTATISYPHLKLDFLSNSSFSCKLQIETATSCAAHAGVGADDLSAADSNTQKYQAEFCTTTNNNWWLRTANGTANSASDSGIAITANRVGIGMRHYPTLGTPEVDLHISQTLVLQKTTNIPTTGLTTDNNLVKFSMKNSTAADRPLLFYGCRLSYKTGSSWGLD